MTKKHKNVEETNFIEAGLSLVCASCDQELAKLYFNLAEQHGIVEKSDISPDFRINGLNYKLLSKSQP